MVCRVFLDAVVLSCGVQKIESLADAGHMAGATTITFVEFAHQLIKPSTALWTKVIGRLYCSTKQCPATRFIAARLNAGGFQVKKKVCLAQNAYVLFRDPEHPEERDISASRLAWLLPFHERPRDTIAQLQNLGIDLNMSAGSQPRMTLSQFADVGDMYC